MDPISRCYGKMVENSRDRGVKTQKMGSVLLVSSSEETLNSVGYLLQQQNMKIVRASSEEEVSFCLDRSLIFDAAIVDLSVRSDDWLSVVDIVSSALREKPIIIFVAQADIKAAMNGIKNGAYDYLMEPIEPDEIILSLRRALNVDFRFNVMRAKQHKWSRESHLTPITSESAIMKEALQRLGILARTEANLVIKGPAGVRKEEWARTAHFLSSRRFQPFIKVKCRNKSVDELMHELFYVNRDVKLRDQDGGNSVLVSANGGTIFFDDVTALPTLVQYKLIDLVEESERLVGFGGDTTLPNVRFMTAIENNAQTFIQDNQLLQPFWEMICGSVVEIPHLAERAEDIPAMAAELVALFAQRLNKTLEGLSKEALEMLQKYNWPGNDRELFHILEHAASVANDKLIQPEDLSIAEKEKADNGYFQLQLHSFQLEHVEEELINQVLHYTGGNMSRTANTLGISRGTLYNKMRKYGIEEKFKKTSQEL